MRTTDDVDTIIVIYLTHGYFTQNISSVVNDKLIAQFEDRPKKSIKSCKSWFVAPN